MGQTGGLPGDNAHWRTSRVNEDELASTVQRGDVAPGTDPDPQTADPEASAADEPAEPSAGEVTSAGPPE